MEQQYWVHAKLVAANLEWHPKTNFEAPPRFVCKKIIIQLKSNRIQLSHPLDELSQFRSPKLPDPRQRRNLLSTQRTNRSRYHSQVKMHDSVNQT